MGRPRRYADGMRRRLLAVPAIAIASALLSGCVPGQSDGGLIGTGTESPVAEATPSATAPTPTRAPAAPSPSPTPTAVAAVTPECTDIATLEWLRTNIHDEIDGPDEQEFVVDRLPGPVAKFAATESEMLRQCTWGIPMSDGIFHVSLHRIDPEVRQRLLGTLASSPAYHARQDGFTGADGEPAPTYSHTVESGIGYRLAYAFYNEYWVIASGTMISPDDAVQLTHKALTATVQPGS